MGFICAAAAFITLRDLYHVYTNWLFTYREVFAEGLITVFMVIGFFIIRAGEPNDDPLNLGDKNG